MKFLISNINSLSKNIEDYYTYLTKERIDKIEKNMFADDKKRSVISGLMINAIVEGREEGIVDADALTDYKTAITKEGKHGKPFFEDSDIYFNVSHSGEYVACAYGDKEVGVDIQKNKELKDNLVKRISHEKDDTVNPLAIWVIKESYVKLLGQGLSFDMRRCYIDFEKNMVIDMSGANKNASFELHKISEDYLLSVCTYA